MPDSDGYEILSGSAYARHVAAVLHHPCDSRVPNTERAKREHLRSCRRGDAARERERLAAVARERATINAQLSIGEEQ